MPTVLRVGAYRFFFYSVDASEPPHIHVVRDDNVAKFWLGPVRLVTGGRFRRTELRELEQLVRQNQETFLEAWHGYFRR
jgi:Domain of unknown function (DUF4160)